MDRPICTASIRPAASAEAQPSVTERDLGSDTLTHPGDPDTIFLDALTGCPEAILDRFLTPPLLEPAREGSFRHLVVAVVGMARPKNIFDWIDLAEHALGQVNLQTDEADRAALRVEAHREALVRSLPARKMPDGPHEADVARKNDLAHRAAAGDREAAQEVDRLLAQAGVDAATVRADLAFAYNTIRSTYDDLIDHERRRQRELVARLLAMGAVEGAVASVPARPRRSARAAGRTSVVVERTMATAKSGGGAAAEAGLVAGEVG